MPHDGPATPIAAPAKPAGRSTRLPTVIREPTPSVDAVPDWYRDAVIYELHVRAFCDSNGDGIGDFRGPDEKLDYLQDLGVTAIWLLPFYPSPLRDDGYDIADYTRGQPGLRHAAATSSSSCARRTSAACG